VSKNPSKIEYQNLNDFGVFWQLTTAVRKLQFIDISSIAERVNVVSRCRAGREAAAHYRKEGGKEKVP
jgi:hypothetical protein